jgi:hypothetical protein
MIKHRNIKLIDPYTTDSIQKRKKTKWYPKEKIFTKLLGCVECSTNGDSLGENKIFAPSFGLSLCRSWLRNYLALHSTEYFLSMHTQLPRFVNLDPPMEFNPFSTFVPLDHDPRPSLTRVG